MKLRWLALCLIVGSCACVANVSGNTIYVKSGATGENDGTSWADACPFLQQALTAAASGDEIWVAAGTYKPTIDYGLVASGTLVQDRLKHFEMKAGVALYGGFAGTETARDQRDWTTHLSLLSGDIGIADTVDDNCYHVLYLPDGLDLDSTSVLDGFTVSSGNANGSGDWYSSVGGGMFMDLSSPAIANCTFSSNAALDGGGMELSSSAPAIEACIFTGNSAEFYGAGMEIINSSPYLADCTFTYNASSSSGGAMENYTANPLIVRCTFDSNSATDKGGAMFNWESASPLVVDCLFSGNVAKFGAGMCNLDSSNPTVAYCSFAGNSSGTGDGGGMTNNDSSPEISDCEFINNSAWHSGGGMFNTTSSSPTISGCTFSGNSTHAFGGGMANETSSPTITSCAFSDNSSSNGDGGGMYNNDASSPTISNCLFSGNSSLSNGGAFYNAMSSSPALTNCVLVGNSSGVGGALYGYQSSPTLTNCSLIGNSATTSGGALYNNNTSSPHLNNCILWGDSAATDAEVYNLSSSVPVFRYCDVQGSGGSDAWVATLGTDNGGNIDGDPLFIDAASDNYRLTQGSPCIDAGDGALAPQYDASGNVRCDDPETVNTGAASPAYTDIGAYEYQLLHITFPTDSGITLERGATYNIAWTSSLPKGAKFRVELLKGVDEGDWLVSAAATKSPLKWTVGALKAKGQEVYPDGDDYRIRITALDGSTSDASANAFAIGTVGSLTVDGPTAVPGGVTVAHYTCTAHYNFGADRDVTSEVKWGCTKVKGAKMSKTGALTTAAVGANTACDITATYGKGKPPLSGTLSITIQK